MLIRTMLIDDEPSNRDVLRKLLTRFCPEVEIVGEAGNAHDGYELIHQLKPDLVFLDIQMPQGNAFGMLNKFSTIDFKIVFVTSFDQYAIRAIKLIVGKIADAVMEGKAIRGKDIEEEDLRAEPMPVGLSRYVDSDEELEDADLLGESTLKYLDLSKTTKDSELTEEPGDELEDEVFEELELTPEDEQPFDAEPDEPAETGELEEGEDVLEASEEDAIADDAEEN